MRLDNLRQRQTDAGAAFAVGEAHPRPLHYGAREREYRAVRSAAGLLDRTGDGRLLLRGADTLTWLQGLVSNDVRLLAAGAERVQACALDATGHIQADLTLVKTPDGVLVDTEREALDHVAALLDDYLIAEDVTIEDASAALACLSIQGPGAAALRPVAEGVAAIVVGADHTGEGGFDLYVTAESVTDAWSALRDAGAVPVGDEVAEILRVEAGIPRCGFDLDASVLPLEAGLQATHISTTKGCYVGQEIVARVLSHGHTNRALSGLLLGDARPAKGDRILHDGRDVGWVTSVVRAMGLPGNIALCYLRHESREPGTELVVAGAFGEAPARVSALPFGPLAL